MSPDYIINSIYNLSDFFKKEENLEFGIEKKFLKNNKTFVLKVILSPKSNSKPPTDKILFRRLNKKGYSCLYYHIPSSVLSSDINETIRRFGIVKNQIKLDILKLKSEHSFERVDIIASSLGVVSACLISNNNNDINNVFLVVPGSCLASSLWKGIRTQKLKKIYEKQNIKLEQLQTLWQSLAPKNNISALDNKNIFIAISKSDKVIPYPFGKELADLVKTKYPQNTSIAENKYLGHYFTVLKYYFFSKKLLE